MRILKTGCGNTEEAFIENRLTDGVNIIFSNDNNKGKTIIFQGMMYALGNDPIFPSGFDYRSYYFYTSIEHCGNIFEFLRKNNTIVVEHGDAVTVCSDTSELKYFVANNVFSLPYIVKDDFQKVVDLSLFYQLFFVGQDKRNPSNIVNSGYYNKQDFANMLYALSGCLTLTESIEKLKSLRAELRKCKANIEILSKRLSFYREHPEIASVVSKSADRENLEKERQEYQALNDAISILSKKRARLINRKIKLENLISELNSLNAQLKTGEIHCQDCGSSNISYVCGDLSFELTNDLVRKNVMHSIAESIALYATEIAELQQLIAQKQEELNRKIQKTPIPISNMLVYTETIRTYSEDEKRLSDLHDKRDALEAEIEIEQKLQDSNFETQRRVKESILASMNAFYKLIDPDGTQIFRDFFSTKSMTFSGSEEQEYYFSRTLAIFWHLKHEFPIIMDCFRKGELSTKKEAIMISEYQKTGVQVILSSTLKDEEYSSGTKYYNSSGINAINYEPNLNSHILQKKYCDQFMGLIAAFGIIL